MNLRRRRGGMWEMKRKAANGLMWSGAVVATAAALVPLLMVLYYVVIQGLPALSLAFFTHLPRPVGEPGGGMANAIVGTLILIGLASAFGLPIGILGGIYLAEFGNNRFGWSVRFAADVLAGVPSIVVGILVWARRSRRRMPTTARSCVLRGLRTRAFRTWRSSFDS